MASAEVEFRRRIKVSVEGARRDGSSFEEEEKAEESRGYVTMGGRGRKAESDGRSSTTIIRKWRIAKAMAEV